MPLSRPECQRLEKAARQAAAKSYSPYSRFKVGAAVLGGSGEIYTGCNVENASYGLCTCAERAAIFTAIAAGERRIEAVAVYTPTEAPTRPCGACRQVIHEFGPKATIVCVGKGRVRTEASLEALLPGAFGPKNLKRRAGR